MNKKVISSNAKYMNIEELETKLNERNLRTGLWRVSNSKLKTKLAEFLNKEDGDVINIYKDKGQHTDDKGHTLFRGVFIVCHKRELSSLELQLLLTEYLKENPNIDRTIPKAAYTYQGNNISAVEETKDIDMQDITRKEKRTDTIDTNNITKNRQLNALTNDKTYDLNKIADNLDNDNRIFGVIDDIKHIQYIEKIDKVEIIKNVGNFNKTYFSIPSYKQEEVLAHSVTIIPVIKCKTALLDYVKNK